MNYLDDNEKQEIARFIESPKLREAVRKLFKHVASENEVTQKGNPVGFASLSDERIGQVVRAQLEARSIIDQAFQEMTKYRTVDQGDKKIINPAR